MSKFSEFGNDLYTGKRSINFVGRRKIFYGVALLMVAMAVLLPMLRGGFNFGIEFRGGSEFRVAGATSTSQQVAVDAVHTVEPEAQPLVSNVGSNGIRVQTEQLTDVKSEEVRVALAQAYGVDSSAVASSFIGANWGADVTGKALNGLVVFVALAAILMALTLGL